MPIAPVEALPNCSITSPQPAGSLLTEKHRSSGKIIMSNRSFDTSMDAAERQHYHLRIPFLLMRARAQCSGMEEATGAPSSVAACYPKRLRASGRDGGTVMTRSPSSLTMLFSRHTNGASSSRYSAARWPIVVRAQQPAKPPIIGVLGTTPSAWAPWVAVFVHH
jgi:hypothetical protein